MSAEFMLALILLSIAVLTVMLWAMGRALNEVLKAINTLLRGQVALLEWARRADARALRAKEDEHTL